MNLELLTPEARAAVLKYGPAVKEMGNSLRILLVEDDKVANKLAFLFLQSYFMRVDVAHDGDEALKLYNTKRYDIVISDICMPKMDGLTLASEIHKIKSNQRIILLTGHADMEYLLSAIRLGISDYVLKPVVVNELIAALYRVCGRLTDDYLQEKFLNSLLEKNAELSAKLARKELKDDFNRHNAFEPIEVVAPIKESLTEKPIFQDEQIYVDTPLLLEAEKMSAIQFLDSLPVSPEHKVTALEGHLEDFDILVNKLFNDYDVTIAEQISQRFYDCSMLISQFYELRDLAFALEKLSIVLTMYNDHVDRHKFTEPMKIALSALVANLGEWVRNIFIYKTATDIRYMHDSFIAEVGIFEMMLTCRDQNDNSADITFF